MSSSSNFNGYSFFGQSLLYWLYCCFCYYYYILFGNKEKCGKKEIKKKVFILFPSLKRRGFEELTFANSLYLHNLD